MERLCVVYCRYLGDWIMAETVILLSSVMNCAVCNDNAPR